MGKGGTRFVGDALGARAGRAKGYTAKERTKDMETFLATGVSSHFLTFPAPGNSCRHTHTRTRPPADSSHRTSTSDRITHVSCVQVHPEVQRLRNAGNHTVPPLPPPKPTRPRIFLNLTISKRAAGRVVIELFDDIVPAPAGHLLGRCTKGTTEGLAGTKVHKVLPGLAILGGRTVK